MARVFISYARGDAVVGQLLRKKIVAAGHDVFLDTAHDRGIRIGEEWEKRLYRELRAADALVAVITSSSVASNWCLAEVAVARSRGAVVLPLQAEKDVELPLLGSLHYLDYAADPDGAVEAVVDELVRVDLGSGRGWAAGRNPYPGLEAFADDRRAVFFGRDDDTQHVLSLLTASVAGDGRIVLISGPSGVGKSSLLKAGVRPAVLDRQGWRALPAFTPGVDPVGALANAFAAASDVLGLGWRREDVRARLNDQRSFLDLVDEVLRARPSCDHLLISIDQFEELLVSTSEQGRARFGALVAGSLGSRLQIVGAFRSEYVGLLRSDPALRDLPVTMRSLDPLSRDALRTVIEGPAREAGIKIDNRLLAEMISDTETGTALPLLAFILWKLATDLDRGGEITTDAYHRLGGVRDAIIHQADRALARAAQPAGVTKAQVLTTLLRLVTLDSGGLMVRERVDRASLTPTQRAHLEPFVAHRLVTTDVIGDRIELSIAHEAFVTTWPPLAERIRSEADGLRQRREIERDATRWREAGRPRSLLWTRPQLRAFLTAGPGAGPAAAASPDRPGARPGGLGPRMRSPSGLARWPGRRARRTSQSAAATTDLSADAVEFLRASVRRDRQLRAQAIAILASLLVMALIGAAVASVTSQSAMRERRLAVSRGLIQEAVTLRQSDPRVALLLSIEAYRMAPTVQARGNLLSVQGTYYADTFARSAAPVHALAFAPSDRHLLATADHTGGVRVWDTTSTRRPPVTTLSHDTPVYTVAFSPDGRLLATGEQDGTVSLWDVERRTVVHRRPGSGEAVNKVAFDPRGGLLAVASADGNLYLLETPTLTQRAVVRVGPGPVDTVAFSRDGAALAAAGADDTVSLWDPTALTTPRPAGTTSAFGPAGGSGGGRLGTLPGRAGTARDVAFSPSEDLLAVGSDDKTVRLWRVSDPARPAAVATFIGHTGPVDTVAFSPDGDVLASGGDEGSVRLWDVGTQTSLTTLSGPTEAVLCLAFSPDGRTLIGAGADRTTGLWHVSRPAPRDRAPAVGSVAVSALAAAEGSVAGSAAGPGSPLAARSQLVATAGTDRTIRLWDLDPPAYLTSIGPPGDTLPVLTAEGPWAAHAMALSKDGSRLVASQGDAVTVFDPRDPMRPTVLTDDSSRGGADEVNFVVNAVDIAPEGGRVVIGATDNTVHLGDAVTGQLGEPIYRHENPVNAVRFMPDGRGVVSASDDGWVTLWNLAGADQDRVDLRGPGPMKSLAISADGGLVASGSDDGTVWLWTVDRPSRDGPYQQRGVRTLTGTDQAVVSVAFSPDAALVAGASVDGSVRIWNAGTGELYAVLSGREASAVAFSADGSSLITTDHDGNLMTWWIDAQRVVDEICKARPALTEQEWSQYMPSDDYRQTCR
ncbi:TIR domain-containing protein [Pseudofrankia sp. BMG5.37]|uniref:nSTAND1 domain-containing NTPase n=1 Tax=Pseudofrankia sp. BMG5.37 TaxID=3050035 RepID=UPI002894809C|nr:TIR domain-containing protein [Pseudofrankia sp. BMG5.37]MDT3445399.1 TIR domain-containing protein [Pseudofrankia sp. BMG5.37]